MGKLISLLFITTFAFSTNASPSSESLPAIAVFGIQDRDSVLDKNGIAKISELMSKAISEGGVYRVVSPDEIHSILSKNGKAGHACSDKECQTRVAYELGADKILSIFISHEDKNCVVKSIIYDLNSEHFEYAAEEKGTCNEAGIVESTRKVAAKILLWAGMEKIEKEAEAAPSNNRNDRELTDDATSRHISGVSNEDVELKTKSKSATDKVDHVKICKKTPGPVSDILFTVGMITSNREGLYPKHKSDTELGLRIDSMVFLGSLIRKPILEDIGISGYFNKVLGLTYGVNENNEWDASQHQWQVGIVYRLALLSNILMQPTFLIRVGYGQTNCEIDVDHNVALSVSYGYPYVALDVYLMLLKPFLRLYASGEYLFVVNPGSDLDNDLGSGYSIRAGVDAVFFQHFNIGIGYELSEFFAKIAETDISDIYRGFFIRIGYIHN